MDEMKSTVTVTGNTAQVNYNYASEEDHSQKPMNKCNIIILRLIEISKSLAELSNNLAFTSRGLSTPANAEIKPETRTPTSPLIEKLDSIIDKSEAIIEQINHMHSDLDI